jgi:hypothetical protein
MEKHSIKTHPPPPRRRRRLTLIPKSRPTYISQYGNNVRTETFKCTPLQLLHSCFIDASSLFPV